MITRFNSQVICIFFINKRLWEKKPLVFSLAIPNSDFGRASQMEKQMLQICLIYGATVDSVVQILIYICMKGFRD